MLLVKLELEQEVLEEGRRARTVSCESAAVRVTSLTTLSLWLVCLLLFFSAVENFSLADLKALNGVAMTWADEPEAL